MGYRSEVKLAFYTSNESQIPFAAVKLWFDENYPKNEHCDVEMGNNYVLVSYEQWKWYDGYPEIQAVYDAITKFTETFNANEDSGAHYEMIRVGEEAADIDRNQSDWCQWLLNVERTIYFG